MSRAEWHVQESLGEQYLERLSQDIQWWNRYSPDLEEQRVYAQERQRIASSMLYGAIEKALDERDSLSPAELQTRLDHDEQREIVQARLATTAVSKLGHIEKGQFGDLRGEKARLTIHSPGVMQQKGLYIGAGGFHFFKPKELEPGSMVESRIEKFSIAPDRGGVLRLENQLVRYIWGLVDPVTAEPRVKLDILSKV